PGGAGPQRPAPPRHAGRGGAGDGGGPGGAHRPGRHRGHAAQPRVGDAVGPGPAADAARAGRPGGLFEGVSVGRCGPAFPEMEGFSPRNLKYMRAFAEAYREESFVQEVLAQIPWGHNLRILERVVDPAEREWYIRL